MKKGFRVCSLFILFLVLAPNISYALSKPAFHDAMRKLWEDHVTWTRLYIISAVGGLPDTKQTALRLLKNQEDIGNAIADFYGRDAANKLTALLKDHILIAADLVGAAKAGDKTKAADLNTRWQKNADDIATFLSTANPKQWPLQTLKSAMRTGSDARRGHPSHSG